MPPVKEKQLHDDMTVNGLWDCFLSTVVRLLPSLSTDSLSSGNQSQIKMVSPGPSPSELLWIKQQAPRSSNSPFCTYGNACLWRCVLMRDSVRTVRSSVHALWYGIREADSKSWPSCTVHIEYITHVDAPAASFLCGWLWLSGERTHLRRFEEWSGNSANIVLL